MEQRGRVQTLKLQRTPGNSHGLVKLQKSFKELTCSDPVGQRYQCGVRKPARGTQCRNDRTDDNNLGNSQGKQHQFVCKTPFWNPQWMGRQIKQDHQPIPMVFKPRGVSSFGQNVGTPHHRQVRHFREPTTSMFQFTLLQPRDRGD